MSYNRKKKIGKARMVLACLACIAFSLSGVGAKGSTVGTRSKVVSSTHAGIMMRGIAAPATNYCQGTFKSGGTDTIVTVQCPSATDTCECSNTGVKCGSTTKAPPEGAYYVQGSCKSTISRDAQAQIEPIR
jgi:hypothetical protein